MGRTLQELQRFFRELKRRNVYKVAATYAVVAFVGFQAAKLLIPSTVLPAWTDEFFLFLLIIGFPVAVVVAWAFELTPDGVRRTAEAEPEEAEAGTRTAYKVLIGLGLLGAAVAGGWYLTGSGESGPERPAGDRSIAVLPFTNMGGDESVQFTQGVHDDLLTRLSQVSELEVISRTSVMRYDGTDMALPEIARELDVTWIVEGGVQQVGDQIKVNAQLIDPRTDTHAWADQYRRDITPENLFAIQSEITREIAGELQARLTPEEERRIDRRPTENLEAYRLYVQGRGFLDQRTESGMRTGIEYLERALERDSAYAPAWAALAEARAAHEGYYGSSSTDVAYTRAWEAVRRALTLNPDLAEAHATAGLLHMYGHEGPAALREFRAALETEPSLAQGHRWLGVLLDVLGRPGAVAHLRRGVEIDPLSPEAHADLAGGLLVRGNFEEALHHARRGKAIGPDYGLVHFLEAVALRHLGRLESAESIHQQERAMRWRPSWHRGELALVQVAAGDSARARESLNQLREAEDGFSIGLVHAALGEPDAGFRAFQRYDSWGMGEVILVRYGYPDALEPLREDPRYRELMREINQQWGLNPDGSLPASPGGSTVRTRARPLRRAPGVSALGPELVSDPAGFPAEVLEVSRLGGTGGRIRLVGGEPVAGRRLGIGAAVYTPSHLGQGAFVNQEVHAHPAVGRVDCQDSARVLGVRGD